MESESVIQTSLDYREWLGTLKKKSYSVQLKAAIAVNQELY